MFIVNINQESEEEIVRFAEALVECDGNCYDAEMMVWDSEASTDCDNCPFSCHDGGHETEFDTALKKAKQYLLDLKVRNIIET